MASVAICTAVLNPNVKSVADRSLSMVLGTPTRCTPSAPSLAATPSVSSPPIGINASMRSRSMVSWTRATPSSVLYGLVRALPRIVPPRWRSPRVLAVVSSTVSQSMTPRQPCRNPTTLWP